jgi:hypothetical protein
VKSAKTVAKESIVKVKRVMVRVDLQIKLQILRNVSAVRLGGFRKKAAPSANLAKLEVSTPTKVKILTSAVPVIQENIVKVKRVMVRADLQIKLQIQQNALLVRQDGHLQRGALNVKRVALVRTVMVVNHAH